MSFIVPGLGQLVQARLLAAIVFFVATWVLWWIFALGWVVHIWAAVDAAIWKPKS